MVNVEICKAQILAEHAYVMYFQTRIQSGAYKRRTAYRTKSVLGAIVKVPFTEEELLEDELATMLRHINRMNELIEVIPTES